MTNPASQPINKQAVYVVDGSRTPHLKAKGQPGPFRASDLAVACGRPLLARQSFSPDLFDEIIMGCVLPGPDEANIARIIALRLGCGEKVPAWTVQRNCASGMQAIDSAISDIHNGKANLVLAGGTEAMSHAPILYNDELVNFLGNWASTQSITQKVKLLSRFRPGFIKPLNGLSRDLIDPIVGLSMGQTAENLAYHFNITRTEMDEYAARSHQRLGKAGEQGFLSEIETLYGTNGQYYEADNGIRPDSSVAQLAKLPPVFDKPFGLITAGNSAQITDGASLLILASEQAVKEHNLTVLGKIVDSHWAGLEPAQMGLGPVHAITPILQRNQLTLADIDYWEINEAFAAQVLACLSAWQDEYYCKQELGLDSIMGKIDEDKLNIDGGGISLGHPVGASGARIVLHLFHVLKRNNAKRGIASTCVSGGQGGAMLIERVEQG